MKKALLGLTLSSALGALGCTNDVIDGTPAAISRTADACTVSLGASADRMTLSTPELRELAAASIDFGRTSSEIVGRMIEACTMIAVDRGIDLGDASTYLQTPEWRVKAASEIRRRCSAIEGVLAAAEPPTTLLEVVDCMPDPCPAPETAPESCAEGRYEVRVVGGAPLEEFHSVLADLLYWLPRDVHRTTPPMPPPIQQSADDPGVQLCERTLLSTAIETTRDWSTALVAAGEALESIQRASRATLSCKMYFSP